jgi:hypothetical protein
MRGPLPITCAPLALLALIGCTQDAIVEQPTPPDMSALLGSYRAPSATFDRDVAQQALDLALEQFGLVADSAVFDTLLGTVNDGLAAEEGEEQAQGLAVQRQGLALEGEGFLRIKRVCPGWGDEGVNEARDGKLDLTMNFSDAGIAPVIWGGAQGCRYGAAEQQALLDGDLQIHLGEDVGLDQIGTLPILVRVGRLQLPGKDIDFSGLDFRVLPAEALIEVKVNMDNGHLLVAFGAETGLVVRASNGNFTCDLEARACVDQQGNSFSL